MPGPISINELLATLPSHVDNTGFDQDPVQTKYAVYTLDPTIDTAKLMNDIHDHVDSKDMAIYAGCVTTLREAYDHFLALRKNKIYNPTFFAAVEANHVEIGVLCCCLNSTYPDEGRIGLTRCPRVSDVFLLPANLNIKHLLPVRSDVNAWRNDDKHMTFDGLPWAVYTLHDTDHAAITQAMKPWPNWTPRYFKAATVLEAYHMHLCQQQELDKDKHNPLYFVIVDLKDWQKHGVTVCYLDRYYYEHGVLGVTRMSAERSFIIGICLNIGETDWQETVRDPPEANLPGSHAMVPQVWDYELGHYV